MGGQRLPSGRVLTGHGEPRPGARRWADVADLLWSMHRASVVAAADRDPTGRLGLEPLGQAWETRNRRAFMAGYLGTPGMPDLVGPDRNLVLRLVSFLELARSVRRRRRSTHPPARPGRVGGSDGQGGDLQRLG